MAPKTRTPKSWTHYLADDEADFTLEEYTAAVLSRILGCLVESTQATQHLEGMVGAIDDMLARADPNYAGSSAVRAALDAQRDERRRLTAAERVDADRAIDGGRHG